MTLVEINTWKKRVSSHLCVTSVGRCSKKLYFKRNVHILALFLEMLKMVLDIISTCVMSEP